MPTKTAQKRSSRPTSKFPLYLHANGQWCKRINGKIRYFGKDQNQALKRFLDEKDELFAGRTPVRVEAATTEYVVNEFIQHSQRRVKTGELSSMSLGDYVGVGKLIVAHLGRDTDPTQLKPRDFQKFLLAMASRYAPSRLAKIVVVTRQIFNRAHQSQLIPNLPSFGPDFGVPTLKTQRVYRAQQGKKLLTAGELQALLQAADTKWKAILLLAINGALGNSDISRLTLADVGGEWLDFAREKTGIDRRIPLWPETQAAIKDAIQERRASKGGDWLFLSEHGGPMISLNGTGSRSDLIAEGFKRLADAAGVHRTRMGLYWCRHTFQTIGDEAGDPIATSAIMGHADNSMSANYRQGISDARLLKVTEHIRGWLFKQTSQPVEVSDAGESAANKSRVDP